MGEPFGLRPHLKIKPVLRYDPTQHKLRLFRLLWQRGKVGDGQGYSAKLSVSFVAHAFGWTREYAGWRLTVMGLQLHHLRAYGGAIV